MILEIILEVFIALVILLLLFIVLATPSLIRNHRKTTNYKEVKCYHTETDCEECFSQNTCSCQNENVLKERRRDNDV